MRSILLLFFCVPGILISQVSNDFVTLKSAGPIPEDFTKLSTDKYKEAYAKNLDEALGKEFFLSTRFYIDQLLLSGQVLFNEPVSNFVNVVADSVLASEPVLSNELRFYVLKSNIVNAFSTDQGIIIVTTGLISHLRSEAELAFILAHEISHFTHKHVRAGYKQVQKLQLEEALSDYEKIRNLSQYSQANELEADKEGVLLYLKSGYPVSGIFSALELLRNADGPFSDVKLDSAFLNTDHLVLPGTLFLPAPPRSPLTGEFHTHPGIDTRLAKVAEVISTGSDSVAIAAPADTEFRRVRDLCRFEGLNIFLYEREYVNALYQCYLLQLTYTGNRFVEVGRLKSLYGLAKYGNRNLLAEVDCGFQAPDGNRMDVRGLVRAMDNQQLTAIAYRHAMDLKLKYPDDKIIALYEADLKKEIAVYFEDFPAALIEGKFVQRPLEVVKRDTTMRVNSTEIKTTPLGSNTSNTNSTFPFERKKFDFDKPKVDKPVITTELTTVVTTDPNRNFHLYAFPDIDKDKFRAELTELEKVVAGENQQPQGLTKAEAKNIRRKGYRMGFEDIVIVDPVVEVLASDENVNHLKSEKQKLSIKSSFDEQFRNLDMKVALVDSKDLDPENMDEYNNLGIVRQWVYEVSSHGDAVNMIPSTHEQMLDISDYYGSDHFMFSLTSIRKDRPTLKWIHFGAFMSVVGIPVMLLDLILLQNYMNLVTVVVNSDTYQLEFRDVVDAEVYGKEYTINNYIYDVLYQLGAEPK